MLYQVPIPAVTSVIARTDEYVVPGSNPGGDGSFVCLELESVFSSEWPLATLDIPVPIRPPKSSTVGPE
jgi:hypothetical protein